MTTTKFLAVLSILVAGALSAGALAVEKTLDIDPVFQQTPVWCWAAVGEMVFRHYGVANINPAGNFQCGIIALLHPVCNQNCGNCKVPAGSLTTMNNMLTQYPNFASQASGTRTRISTRAITNSLSLDSVKAEIDAGRPIVAGISPSGYNAAGVSQHVALIVGYDRNSLIINDPFPFSIAFTRDPYEAAGGEEIGSGQYRIAFSAFVNRLQWRESIYGIRCTGSDCNANDDDDARTPPNRNRNRDSEPEVQYGRTCQTPVLRCGPFYNQPALPIGSSCYCATRVGPVGGRVTKP